MGIWISRLFELALYDLHRHSRNGRNKIEKNRHLHWDVFVVNRCFFCCQPNPQQPSCGILYWTPKYSIPWQYNPINGSSKQNGKYFIVHASYPDFAEQYYAQDYNKHLLNLGIHSLDDNERVKYGSSLDDMCSEDGCGGLGLGIVRYPYYFVENGFIYTVYYGGDISPFRDMK